MTTNGIRILTFSLDVSQIERLLGAISIITTVAGTGTADYTGDTGLATSATLNFPRGVASDASGNLYIADTHNHVIRRVTKIGGLITTVAGTGTADYTGNNGLATSATLQLPYGVASDASGNLYIADSGNHVIRRVTKIGGLITTVAGTGTPGYTGDTGLATSATLRFPYGVASDASGNLYIADSENQRIRLVDKKAPKATIAQEISEEEVNDILVNSVV